MKNKKIVTILLIILAIITMLTTTANATINPNDYKPSDLTSDDYDKAFGFAGTILNAILIVGVVISVTMTMVLGIKYMLGSVEERAEYKKTMLPMFVGMIMLFTTTTIVGIIYNVMVNMQNI